jgi:hypothetical protein
MKLRWLGLAALAAAGLGAWIYLAPVDRGSFGFAAPGAAAATTKVLVIAYGYGITVIGVVLGSFYRELQRRQSAGVTEIKLGELRHAVFGSTDFWMSLCGSPLVYALLLQSVATGPA